MIKILIADDYAPFRQVLEDFLETADTRLKVTARATNGKEALHVVQNASIDVAIIDIRMPIMDGLELTRHLRAAWGNSLGIITYTGLRSALLTEQALLAGANLHLVKPFELFALKDSVIRLGEANKRGTLTQKRARVV